MRTHRSRGSAWSAAGLALALQLAGCATSPPPPPREPVAEAHYPGVLRPAGALARDVLWRQHVTAAWGEGEEREFDAVVQKQGDTLTVMALSPTGSLGIALVLRAGQVELIQHMPEALPFPPRFILLDVQRALYPWLPDPSEPRADGEHSAQVDGELVEEEWRAGRLHERRFTRLDGVPAGVIVVRYAGGRMPGVAPPAFELANGWLGYDLRVETIEELELDDAVMER